MRRMFPVILALVIAVAIPRTWGEESPGAQELRELRLAVQQQSKQIELLARQVGELTRAVEGKGERKPAESAPTTVVEPAKPATEPVAEPVKAEAVPKAEAVGGPKHTVAKGETLTSIAKHYNISVADLKSANKIDNERKLQIGQILSVPTAKAPESTEKKENP